MLTFGLSIFKHLVTTDISFIGSGNTMVLRKVIDSRLLRGRGRVFIFLGCAGQFVGPQFPESMPSAAEVQSPNHWTATECPRGRILTHVYLLLNITGFFYSSFSKIQDKSPFFFFWTGRLKTLKSKITFPLRFSSYSSTFDNKLMVRFMLSAINSFKIYLNFNLRKTKNVLVAPCGLQDLRSLARD